MEGGPNIEVQEQMPPPDLLEVFADRQVEVFGITGSFRDLTAMCPVDLSDPRVTLEAKNEFVVKAANEAGLEIEPEHEALFTRVIDQHGLERKFTIAEPMQESASQPQNVPKVEREVVSATNEIRKQRVELDVNKAVDSQAQIQSEQIQHNLRTMAESDSTSKESDNTVAATTANEHASEDKRTNTHPLERSTHLSQAPVPKSSSAELPGNEVTIQPQTPEIENKTEPEQVDVAFAEPDTPETSIDLELHEASRDTLPDIWELPILEYNDESIIDAEAPAAPIEADWLAELAKEPEEVYEDFVVVLQNYLEFSALFELPLQEEYLTEAEKDETEDKSFVPPILGLLTEKLAQLEPIEMESAVPIIHNIVGTIHGIHFLENQEADPELLAAAETQLETLCVSLFETLGIEHDEEIVNQFIQVLLSPMFKPKKQGVEKLDLERVGTREAKHFAVELLPGQKGNSVHPSQYLLGIFALFYASIGAKQQVI